MKAFSAERNADAESTIIMCWGDVHFKYQHLKFFVFNVLFAYCMSMHLTE